MAQTAIRFGLMHSGASGVLVGFGQLEHIDQAVDAAAMGPLDEDVMLRLEELYDSDFGQFNFLERISRNPMWPQLI